MKFQNAVFLRDSLWCVDGAVDLQHVWTILMLSKVITVSAMKKFNWSIRSPVTATRNEPRKATLTSLAAVAQIERARSQKISISQSAKSLRLPRERHLCRAPSKPPRMPRSLQRLEIPACATRTHTHTRTQHFETENVFPWFWLPHRPHTTAWCKFCETQLPKVFRACPFLTILASELVSRRSVVTMFQFSLRCSARETFCLETLRALMAPVRKVTSNAQTRQKEAFQQPARIVLPPQGPVLVKVSPKRRCPSARLPVWGCLGSRGSSGLWDCLSWPGGARARHPYCIRFWLYNKRRRSKYLDFGVGPNLLPGREFGFKAFRHVVTSRHIGRRKPQRLQPRRLILPSAAPVRTHILRRPSSYVW